MNTDRSANNPDGAGPHLSDETLSDLASGRLDEAARDTAQRHLAACPECAAAARDDALIKSLLHELPTPRPSRSFQLTDAQARANARRWPFPSLASSLPALRVATVAVALLLLAVSGIDWLTRPSGNGSNSGHYAAMVALTPTAALETSSTSNVAAEVASTQAPMAKSANVAPTEAAESNPAPASAPNESADNEAPPGSASDSSAASMAGAAVPAISAAKIAPPEATPVATPMLTATPSPTATATASPTPAPMATPVAVAAGVSRPDRTGWRIAELGLGLLLLWLIVTYAGAWQTSRKRG